MTNPIFTPAPFQDEMDVELWPRWSADHCDVTKVVDMNNVTVNTIIEHAPLAGGKEHILIDARTQHLELGFHTIGAGWHIDAPGSGDVDQHAIHHVYIIGENRTEFKMDDGSTMVIPKNHYVTYEANVQHQGVEVHTEEFRLFVRIQEVNSWPPRRKEPLMSYFPTIFTTEGLLDICEEEYYNRFLENSHLNLGAK